MAGFLARLDAFAARAPPAHDPRGRAWGRARSRPRVSPSGSPSAFVTGIDLPDADARRALERTGGCPPRFADIGAAARSRTTRFDLVLAIEVLEHVPEPDGGARASSAGSPARDVVLSVPREPIWRVANMARGKYWGDLRQHARPHPALEPVGRSADWSARHLDVADGAQPDAVDDGRAPGSAAEPARSPRGASAGRARSVGGQRRWGHRVAAAHDAPPISGAAPRRPA